MTLSGLLNRPITISQRSETTTTDTYGNEVPDPPVLFETVGELQQLRRDEPGDAGELSDTEWTLVLPADTDIRTGDTVHDGLDDEDYEVVGDPWRARNPRTRQLSHVEATLRRTATDLGGS